MIKEEETIDEVIEAQRKGHKFIKLYLNRSMVGRNQSEIVISGVVALRGIPKGSGMGGMPEYEFESRGGEALVFRYSRDEREYTAWMFDDMGPGYFSSVGYNRDILASHLEDSFFEIRDQSVLNDVMERRDFLTNNPGKKNKIRKVPMLETTALTAEDIDAQIQHLLKKKETIQKSENPAELNSLSDEDARRNIDAGNVVEKGEPGRPSTKVGMSPEEIKADRNKKQKEYRARKKLEKEKKLEQLENA